MKLFAFTMDLEADYGGVVDHYGIFKDKDKVDEVLSVITSLGVRITVFTVGEIFSLFPEIIDVFEKYKCEFEPHSYSHNFLHPDSETEIEKAKSAYFRHFNKYPKGYRAPRGKISDSGIKLLEKHGFLYDSSVFPSYFPNPFRYIFSKRDIHYYRDSNVVEIPFTSITPFRLTLSASYIKLLGVSFFKRLPIPEVVCFGSHLHDFINNERSFNKLPVIWKLIYSRNKYKGIDCCVKFLEHIKEQGYQFCYMSEIYNSFKKDALSDRQ